ncbi:hypothetical protein HF086_005553 [Spodoptera exigua]|uniref:Coiled-coil protein 142 C-terminal domain-containing protein n=1 Tax=Spodoptera exigua TaxID=7107 RepID=A0A922MSY9_SPOEX|nr:hypothetical protein HF086_005553 [Spodoptera exigua]
MLSTKVTSKKWISEETPDEEELFSHCREMEMVCFAVTKVILDSDNKWKGALGKNNSHSLSNRNYIMELVNIQVLSKSRAEINCQRLINCLVKVYQPDHNSDNDSSSSSAESLEIYQHTSFSDNINSILQSEEMYIEILLDTVANMSPNLLGHNGVKKLKNGRIQASKKAAHKVTEYYQNILWGDVGSCLEHIVLWWSHYPLAMRSPNTSQNLREWLFATFNVNSKSIYFNYRIIKHLYHIKVATLTTNLKSTTLKINPEISLYITEVYHSIHTYRLWCLAETRRLANLWEMKDFFRIAHNDMQACMEQLINLRFADHTVTIESGKIGVHENVCAKMREKLVSEVKVNIQKLKDATEEIIQVLSSVCATTSLAHLTMIFPSNAEWRIVTRPPQTIHSIYVHEFLNKMLLPVIMATQDITTLNMILRIMCESWLHHIYVAKVKFTKDAAMQLLHDFNEVRNWLSDCKQLAAASKKQMLQNEVLRRCEGVGRLLLHAPGDLISMQDSTMQSAQQVRKEASENDTPEQLMPAEMYVPNQKQWLTLRAKKMKGPIAFTLCCVVLY